ncbi:hypothetical protein HH214_17540 [Mucilaginibacter robiniae]|uniref:Uncharacterized protein n=1 Tax=Mucilaginibacter robiniae TaxID=2728022 RepID=A0A7L5E587_9SPHI|nr:hypothetical protein [Mucilaginibacter robiniae]QJD97547.1 hypothetical protein HH214_17540 [Mucilaginibacter robiniae]
MIKNIRRVACFTIFLSLLVAVCLYSCKKDTKSETVVYTNNFESGNLNNINGGVTETYNGTKVLGRYNNGQFTLSVPNLPKHDMVEISFDLYIHDNWDGNTLGIDGVDGPDIWQMLVDGNIYFNTTFSNLYCNPGVFCPPQSYPNNYPNNNHNPKIGSYQTGLPPACNATSYGTTLYKIDKVISHSSSTVQLQCLDHLIQKNASDPKCDESWSVDNIQIKAIAL